MQREDVCRGYMKGIHTVVSRFGNSFGCVLLNVRDGGGLCKRQDFFEAPCLLHQRHRVHILQAVGYHCECFYVKVVQFLIIENKRSLKIVLSVASQAAMTKCLAKAT